MEVFVIDVDKLYPSIGRSVREDVAATFEKLIERRNTLSIGGVIIGTVKRVEKHEAEVRVYVELRDHVERGSTV